MDMLQFFDDADLAEAERDQYRRILYSSPEPAADGRSTNKFPLSNEFPFENVPLVAQTVTDNGATSPMSTGTQVSSQGVCSPRAHTPPVSARTQLSSQQCSQSVDQEAPSGESVVSVEPSPTTPVRNVPPVQHPATFQMSMPTAGFPFMPGFGVSQGPPVASAVPGYANLAYVIPQMQHSPYPCTFAQRPVRPQIGPFPGVAHYPPLPVRQVEGSDSTASASSSEYIASQLIHRTESSETRTRSDSPEIIIRQPHVPVQQTTDRPDLHSPQPADHPEESAAPTEDDGPQPEPEPSAEQAEETTLETPELEAPLEPESAVECADTETDTSAKSKATGNEDELKDATVEPRPEPVRTKMWSDLFQNKNALVLTAEETDAASAPQAPVPVAPSVSPVVNGPPPEAPVEQMEKVPVPPEDDPQVESLKEFLDQKRMMHRGPVYSPKGLSNTGNWCYVNSVLQALIACPPFFHMLRQFEPFAYRNPTCTPVLDAFALLVAEFSLDRKGERWQAQHQRTIDPNYIRQMVTRLRSDHSFKGRQEDAEEFLLHVLNGIHEEMVAAGDYDAHKEVAAVNGTDDDEWHQVGPGRKSAVTRQVKFSQSLVSQIFVGQLRYSLKGAGLKESANLEPFFTLPLEIQNAEVKDIASAMAFTLRKERVQTTTKKIETEAVRRACLQELPPVLILQLKCFHYTSEGVKKTLKRIEYKMELTIDKELLSPSSASKGPLTIAQRKYKLFAVVFHHGAEAAGGHYTSDVFHAGQWIEMDDTRIGPVLADHVTQPQETRVPYLLFYRRCDLMQQGAA